MNTTNEKPKRIWMKPWKGLRGLLFWFIALTCAAFIVIFCFGMGTMIASPLSKLIVLALVYAVGIAFVGVLMVAFVRWLCCWRNFRRFLLGLAGLAVLVMLFYAEEDWRGWHAWNKFKHEWEAKGEKFDFPSFIPSAVPDDQNFAMAPIVASSWEAELDKNGHQVTPFKTNIIDRLQMNVIDYSFNNYPTNGPGSWQKSTVSDLKIWQDYYRDLASKTNEFPVPPQPQTPVADVLFALSKYDSAIEELRQARQRPYSRFPNNYDTNNPFTGLLPELTTLRGCCQVFQLRAVAELQNGQSDEALADVKLMLRLADSIRTEPFLISHLVRIAILQITLQPVWEGLAEHKWSDSQLVELDRELAKLDFLADYEFAIRGERAASISMIDYLRRTRKVRDVFGPYGNSTLKEKIIGLVFYSFPSGWFYQNQLRYCRFFMQRYLPLSDVSRRIVPPASLRNADTAFDLECRHANPLNNLEATLLPALGACVRKSAYEQESVDLARVACALERYQLTHGEYPESLDVLVPQFIAKLPHDIINGQPLHYRRTADGQFVLYSVGWNEKDDDGMVGLTESGSMDITKGDWVWRYPAR